MDAFWKEHNFTINRLFVRVYYKYTFNKIYKKFNNMKWQFWYTIFFWYSALKGN